MASPGFLQIGRLRVLSAPASSLQDESRVEESSPSNSSLDDDLKDYLENIEQDESEVSDDGPESSVDIRCLRNFVSSLDVSASPGRGYAIVETEPSSSDGDGSGSDGSDSRGCCGAGSSGQGAQSLAQQYPVQLKPGITLDNLAGRRGGAGTRAAVAMQTDTAMTGQPGMRVDKGKKKKRSGATYGANGTLEPGEKRRQRHDKIEARRMARATFDAAAISRRLREFYDGEEDVLALPPAGKSAMDVTMTLAKMYGLKAFVQGGNKKKFVLISWPRNPRPPPSPSVQQQIDQFVVSVAAKQLYGDTLLRKEQPGAAVGSAHEASGRRLGNSALNGSSLMGADIGHTPAFPGVSFTAAASRHRQGITFVSAGTLDPNAAQHEAAAAPSSAAVHVLPALQPAARPEQHGEDSGLHTLAAAALASSVCLGDQAGGDVAQDQADGDAMASATESTSVGVAHMQAVTEQMSSWEQLASAHVATCATKSGGWSGLGWRDGGEDVEDRELQGGEDEAAEEEGHDEYDDYPPRTGLGFGGLGSSPDVWSEFLPSSLGGGGVGSQTSAATGNCGVVGRAVAAEGVPSFSGWLSLSAQQQPPGSSSSAGGGGGGGAAASTVGGRKALHTASRLGAQPKALTGMQEGVSADVALTPLVELQMHEPQAACTAVFASAAAVDVSEDMGQGARRVWVPGSAAIEGPTAVPAATAGGAEQGGVLVYAVHVRGRGLGTRPQLGEETVEQEGEEQEMRGLEDEEGGVKDLFAVQRGVQVATGCRVGVTKQQVQRQLKKQRKEERRKGRREGVPAVQLSPAAALLAPAEEVQEAAALQVAAFEKHTTGIGSQLMLRMGWVVGGGLGRAGQGRADPLAAVRRPKNLGLGAQ